MPPHLKDEAPPAPSPFEDYQQYPFHWTGESLRTSPVDILTSSQPPPKSSDRSALIAQFPDIPPSKLVSTAPLEVVSESVKPAPRKRRFRQLRRAMSLSNVRNKPTPPDTAPPTPTVPNQVPSSVGIQSLESLTHWQLPDPTATAPSLGSGNLIVWPSSLVTAPPVSPRGSYQRPLGQLSPPSSIPSESDILPRESLIGLGIHGSSTSPLGSPQGSPYVSPRTLYPPTLYDSIDLTDPAVLEKNASGKVVTGTAEGLVAHITSPDCLDYDVLSDFFMMYRKFMSPTKLLGLLCARFEWGLIRGAVVKPPDNEGNVEKFHG
jgi:RasGEF N-terminal motif